MKFAKRLEDEAMPEWRSEYVSYKKLKKIIKRLQALDNDVEKGEIEDANQKQDNGKDFIDALLTELDKVENFFKTQLDSAVQRKSYLVNQLNDLDSGKDTHTSHVDDHTSATIATHENTDEHDPSKHVKTRRLSGSSASNILLPMINSIQSATRKMTTRMNLKKALLELYHLACILSTFRKLNIVAYTKIVKKFVKYVRNNDQAYLMDILQQSSLYKNAPLVEALIKELDGIFHKHFPTDPTYHKLKNSNMKTMESMEYSIAISSRTSWIFTTEGCGFIGGLLNGINLIAFIQLITIWLRTTQSHAASSFYTMHATDIQILKCIYFALGLPILLGNGVIANMYIWQHFKINYRLIFGCTHSMLPIHFTILIASYTLFYLQYINASLTGHIHSIPLRYQPLICLMIMIGLTIYPWDFFYMHSRYWWNKSLSRILVTPYYSIQFRDFFIVDQWMSISTFFLGIGWVFAYTISGEIEWNSTHTVPKPTWYTIAFATIPAYIRCIQCLRRYWQQSTHATAYLHLINLGKYLFAIASIVILAMSTFASDYPFEWFVVGILVRLASSCYSLVWDIVMDFGFGQMRYLSWTRTKSKTLTTGAGGGGNKVKVDSMKTPQMTPPQSATGTNEHTTGMKQRRTWSENLTATTAPPATTTTSTSSSAMKAQYMTLYPSSNKIDSTATDCTPTNESSVNNDPTAPTTHDMPTSSTTNTTTNAAATAGAAAGASTIVSNTPQLMVYPLWCYYGIMSLDIALRFLWIPLLFLVDPGISLYIIACMEVIRRVCWNIFRVEIEHIHNCIAKRVIDTVDTVVVPSLIAQELYEPPSEEDDEAARNRHNEEEEEDSIHSQVFPILPTQADALLEGNDEEEQDSDLKAYDHDDNDDDAERAIRSDQEVVMPVTSITDDDYNIPASSQSMFSGLRLSPVRDFGASVFSVSPMSNRHFRRVLESEEMSVISLEKEHNLNHLL